MRGDGKNATSENASAAAAEIINYATLLEQTIMRLRTVQNCSLSEISFENNIVTGYTNTAAPRADKTCNVFDANGGGMAWKTPSSDWLEEEPVTYSLTSSQRAYGAFNFPRDVCITGMGTSTCFEVGYLASRKTLLVGLTTLKKDVCDAINKQLGETTNTTAENALTVGEGTKYRGAFYSGGRYTSSIAKGKRTLCIYNDYSGYTFYHVLEPQ
jgi:hypothetical protein